VVDGFINFSDSTQFYLSYSTNLSDPLPTKPISGASFYIEPEDNSHRILLNEYSDGLYKTYHQKLEASQRYRINITLSNGKQYLSDYVPLKLSPAIDTVEWNPT